jgi:hypothetical protein
MISKGYKDEDINELINSITYVSPNMRYYNKKMKEDEDYRKRQHERIWKCQKKRLENDEEYRNKVKEYKKEYNHNRYLKQKAEKAEKQTAE